MRRLAAAVGLVVLLAATAGAHQQGISYSDVALGGGQVRFDLILSVHDVAADVDGDGTVTVAEVESRRTRLERIFAHALAVEAGGRPCPLVLGEVALAPNEGIRFRLSGPCPDARPVRVLVRQPALTRVAGYNLATVRVGGAVVEHVFTPDSGALVLAAGGGGLGDAFRRFFVLGVEHIATGYDHVLFLLALLLVGGGLRSLVAIVTAFTVAHSLTLALAVLGVVDLPARLVESVIALSIAWVALENVLIDRVAGRWRLTFAFGLVHGFGFASILRAMDLPREGLAVSLLAFNLGVEAGQLVVVAIAYPIVAQLQHSRHRRRWITAASGVVLVLALWWFVTRAFG